MGVLGLVPLATPVSGEETPVSGEESETSSQEDVGQSFFRSDLMLMIFLQVEEDEETKRDEDVSLFFFWK